MEMAMLHRLILSAGLGAMLIEAAFAYTENERAAALFPRAAIRISSLTKPALTGVYSVDPEAQFQLNAVVTYLLVNDKFPGQEGGGMTAPFGWVDVANKLHTGWSKMQFKAFATCVADYTASVIIARALVAAGKAHVTFPFPGCSIP